MLYVATIKPDNHGDPTRVWAGDAETRDTLVAEAVVGWMHAGALSIQVAVTENGGGTIEYPPPGD